MVQYIIRRIIATIPVLFGILFVVFILIRLIPGDPCHAMLGEKATQEVCDRFIRAHGLDKPLLVQFGIYINDVIRGNFGDSFRYGIPITRLLIERLPATIELSLAALFVSILVGIPLGILASVKHNSWIDVLTMLWANIGVSMPVFWLGLMLAYVFAILLKGTPIWLPPSGRLTAGIDATPFYDIWGLQLTDGGWKTFLYFLSNLHILNAILSANWALLGDAIRHLILPALALGTIPLALIARMTRSSMLEVLGQDFIRTARSKGLPRRLVIFKHTFRNSLLPLVTVIGLSLGSLLSGAVLTETIFGLSGVGRTLYDAITARDYGIVQAFTVVIAVFFVLINLLVDISYAYLDPRIRLE